MVRSSSVTHSPRIATSTSIGPKSFFCVQVASPRLCISSSANRVTAWVSRSSSANASSKSKRPRRASSSRSRRQPPLERDRGTDVAGVGRGRYPQQVADRLGEADRLVDLGGGVERGAAQLRRQRRRAVQVAAPVGEQAGEMGGRVAVAAVLEHARQELVGRLLRAQLRHLLLGRRQEQPRLELQKRGDQDQELRRRVEVELAGVLQVLEVGDHDLAQRDLGQAHLLAQHDRHQEVERAREDVQVEVELSGSHRHRAEG